METSSHPAAAGPKNIILVNTGNLKKKFILHRLRQLGHRLTLIAPEKNWATPYVADWILADTRNHDLAIRKVAEYLKHHPIDGILTFWEDDVLLTAKLTDTYKFIGIPYKVALKARNKFLFRQFCRQNHLPSVNYHLIDKQSDLKHVIDTFTFPVVVKPAYGSSSAYVIKAEDPDELGDIFKYIHQNLTSQVESSLTDGKTILVEEYIDGDEVDVDMLVQNGKVKFSSITDNHQTQEPFFMETSESIPSLLPATAQNQLLSLAEEVLEKMGLAHGCVHFEAKVGPRGAIPIEINLRMGGDETWPFIKRAWRVDLIEHAVNIACGVYIGKISKPKEPYTYLTSLSFIPQRSGVISQLEYPKNFPKQYRVKDFHFYKQLGDVVLTPPAEYEFLGWMSAQGENMKDSQDNLDAAAKLVQYQIIPFTSSSAVGKTTRRRPQTAAFLKDSPILLRRHAKIEKILHLDLAKQRQLHLGIACNSYDAQDHPVEADLSVVGQNIQNTLIERGYQTTYIDFNDLDKAIDILKSGRVDLVFNVCERINNSSLLEPHAAALFDMLQIPYTGSNPFTLSLSIDKIRVKKLLTYNDIPTAKWDYIYDLDDDIRDDLTFPIMVKPGNTDNSIGITQESVVETKKQLHAQVRHVLLELNRPVLLEEYLFGDEYDVSIIGSDTDDLQVLPLSRSIFNMPSDMWNIYTMEYKFIDGALPENYITSQRPPKNVSKKLLALISEIALDTYNLLDCHDYGRVEVKLDADGNPHVLELNPNPSINIGDCVPKVASLIGMDYGDFIERIISLAIRRYQNRPPYYHLQTGIL